MKGKLTPATFFASALGVGFVPFAPGTFGTLLAASVFLILPRALFSGTGWFWFGGALLLLTGFAVWISGRAEKTLGHDAPAIVIDEVCGYFLAVTLAPVHTWQMALYAFVLFRLFDIAKPWPVNRAQRLPGGWGVVADDLLAGVYTNLIIQIIYIIRPAFFGQP